MTATAARAPARSAGRMALSAIESGKKPGPDRIQINGVEGVGKSTFANDADRPIFIGAEDGLGHLDVQKFPEPQTFAEVLEAVDTLRLESHNYATLALDTLDWIEALVWREVCTREGWANIESPGYGKGYIVTADEWRKLIVKLSELRRAKGMEIIFISHATIRPFSNPAGMDYSRYETKLHKLGGAIIREWCDCVLFAVAEDFVKSDSPTAKKGKGVSTGRRVLKTERTAAWDAKNRWNLPPELPLSYPDYAAARANGQDPKALAAVAADLIEQLQPAAEEKAKIEDHIAKNLDNAVILAKAVSRLRTLVADKAGA